MKSPKNRPLSVREHTGRQSKIERTTRETRVEISLNIDGEGKYNINTTIPFMDHMLSLLSGHSLIDLNIKARGDTDVDYHHLVEDIGISLGKALEKALGEKIGINRYGMAIIPMDEALVGVSLDISSRGYLYFDLNLKRKKIGNFDTELIEEFFRALAINSGITLHTYYIRGKNTHHIIEAAFKALGQALKKATTLNPREKGVPSTKGKL